jgi:hypothetical protein
MRMHFEMKQKKEKKKKKEGSLPTLSRYQDHKKKISEKDNHSSTFLSLKHFLLLFFLGMLSK